MLYVVLRSLNKYIKLKFPVSVDPTLVFEKQTVNTRSTVIQLCEIQSPATREHKISDCTITLLYVIYLYF